MNEVMEDGAKLSEREIEVIKRQKERDLLDAKKAEEEKKFQKSNKKKVDKMDNEDNP